MEKPREREMSEGREPLSPALSSQPLTPSVAHPQGQGREANRRSQRCRDCMVRRSALFGGLTEEELDAIAWRVPDQTLKAGQVLYSVADAVETVWIIRSGLIKLERPLADGTYRIVRLARRSDVLALETLLGGTCDHTAVALADSDVCRVPLDVMRNVMRHHPGMGEQILRHWHSAVQRADDWLTSYSLGTARQKVARFLVGLMENCGSGGVPDPQALARRDWPEDPSPLEPSVITIPSRDDVGAILGITKETASRLIADFYRSGALSKLPDHRTRVNRSVLLSIAGGGDDDA